MDLIEEYLKAVAVLLPRAQRDDIVAELRDMILTRVEAREEELGRALTPDEVEAVLREIGHPLVVAARYSEGPQHAVGPLLYPYWLFGVKVVIAIEAVVALVIFITGSFAHGDVSYAFGRALITSVSGAATLIGFATIAAWLIERQGIHIDYLDHWRVRDLKALGLGTGGWWNAVHEWGSGAPRSPRAHAHREHREQRYEERYERRQAAAERRHDHRERVRLSYGSPARRGVFLIAWSAVLVFWWSGGMHIFGPHNAVDFRDTGIDPGPLAAANWQALRDALYWPVLAFFVAIMAKGAALFTWPNQPRLHGVLDVLSGSVLLALVWWLWNTPPLAPSVQVDSVEGFFLRMTSAFSHGPPYPLTAIATAVLVATGFGAVVRIVQGVLETLIPGRYWSEPAPPPINGERA